MLRVQLTQCRQSSLDLFPIRVELCVAIKVEWKLVSHIKKDIRYLRPKKLKNLLHG